MGAGVVPSLEPGFSPGPLEYKISFTRPMSADTGVVRGEGKTLHVGRQMAIGEGRLLDATGRLLPPGTTTCQVFPEGVSLGKFTQSQPSPARPSPTLSSPSPPRLSRPS